jgi:hypothetical protein
MVVVPRFLAAGLLTFTLSGNAFAAPHRQRSLLPQDAYWDAKCKGDVTDPGKSPQTQWAAAKSSLALAAANHFWNNDPASQGSEVQISYIDDLLKLWDSKLGHEDCNLVDNSCNFDSLQCTDLPHPGAWQILKSIANFHTVSR